MSRIEELIKEKCPDGVVFEKTNNLVKDKFWLMPATPKYTDSGVRYITSKNIKNNKIDFSNAAFISEGDYLEISKNRSIQVGDLLITMIGTLGECAFVEEEVSFYGQNIYLLRLDTEKVDRRFYKYCFDNFKKVIKGKKNNGNQGYLKAGSIDNFEIPVPPIEIQQEIVRNLDKFAELEVELQAELDARKKQYDEYLNLLMDFTNDDSIKYMSVGELFEIKNGLNKEKEAFGKGKPIINFTDVFKKRYLVKGNFTGLVDVNEEEIERYGAKEGDVFFTRTSETREDIGMSSTLIENVEGCVFSGFVLRARPITNLLLPKFCSYYFSAKHVRKTIMRYASFTTRATTTGPKLSKIMVPILPISQQQEIVDILDRMDAICNDLEKGLPAEIEARHKQYEYYRDKLLTFERKVV